MGEQQRLCVGAELRVNITCLLEFLKFSTINILLAFKQVFPKGYSEPPIFLMTTLQMGFEPGSHRAWS